MVRYVLPAAFALLLPSCGSSSVSCAFDKGSTVGACADYSFSGDTSGGDVTTLEQSECAGAKGTVVDSCATTDTLGICTITNSLGGATLTAVEYYYKASGLTAAQAKQACEDVAPGSGITAMWSGS